MKRAVIVHCWGGKPEYAWYPWLKLQLEKLGYEVFVPQMPDTDEPKLEKWLPELAKIIGSPDEELVLIGHSLGNVAIMRYLETLQDYQYVGKVIMVAGFTDELGFKELENFFVEPLNFPKIKSRSKNGFTVIQSDNDPYVSAQYGDRLKDELGANLIIKHNAGHMSNDDSCTELPEIIQSYKRIDW